jgi:hypothetical protein
MPMNAAEQRVIDAARTLARANSPPITDLIVGPAHRNLRQLFSVLLVAVKKLDNPTPPPPGSGVLDEIQRAAGAYELKFNNWCQIWNRGVIADARFIPLLDEAVRAGLPLTRERIDTALGKVAWDA